MEDWQWEGDWLVGAPHQRLHLESRTPEHVPHAFEVLLWVSQYHFRETLEVSSVLAWEPLDDCSILGGRV